MATKLENALVKLGKQTWAQHLRHIQHLHGPQKTKSDPDWPKDIILMDTQLREIGQREIYLREEIKALVSQEQEAPLSTEQRAQLAKWQMELDDLARKYWHLEREFYRREASVPAGPLQRAYVAWKKNPEWYLVGYLRNDCAGRGGCCGRSCGCCERPRDTEKRIRWGHCTIECGCCRRARGFDLTHEDRVRYQKLFDCDLKENEALWQSLKLAYVFGLV
ncbi:hypothetical protein BDV28DRAFT_43479 [Aspergillus coremiiformis]|uniref:Uncharacterized protein n=1 Tax=Aspergillus coremiiformis TaxID=138285 RepID=A0A5N6Z029_9EURO|nr:hypothetical protein BDV28DRAFT_43479 [Aspergillus coremiiformis]